MFSANTALRLLKPFFRYRSIAREHNTYDEKNLLQRLADRMLSYVSYRIVAVSRGVAAYASRQAGIPERKFVVIENGIDLAAMDSWRKDVSRDILRRELGFAPDDIVLLSLGRLKTTKNHAALIRAFARFSPAHPAYRLVIIGDGIERENTERLITELGNDRITLTQKQGREAWPYYRAVDWFVLPSLREGFPNVILEAMAFGLPVLATRVAGSTDCVVEGENGFLVTPSEADLYEGLMRIAANESSREAFGTASRQRAERYALPVVVSRYEALYTECVTQP